MNERVLHIPQISRYSPSDSLVSYLRNLLLGGGSLTLLQGIQSVYSFKNMNLNVIWTRFPNLRALNNPRQFDMPLKSFYHNLIQTSVSQTIVNKANENWMFSHMFKVDIHQILSFFFQNHGCQPENFLKENYFTWFSRPTLLVLENENLTKIFSAEGKKMKKEGK